MQNRIIRYLENAGRLDSIIFLLSSLCALVAMCAGLYFWKSGADSQQLAIPCLFVFVIFLTRMWTSFTRELHSKYGAHNRNCQECERRARAAAARQEQEEEYDDDNDTNYHQEVRFVAQARQYANAGGAGNPKSNIAPVAVARSRDDYKAEEEYDDDDDDTEEEQGQKQPAHYLPPANIQAGWMPFYQGLNQFIIDVVDAGDASRNTLCAQPYHWKQKSYYDYMKLLEGAGVILRVEPEKQNSPRVIVGWLLTIRNGKGADAAVRAAWLALDGYAGRRVSEAVQEALRINPNTNYSQYRTQEGEQEAVQEQLQEVTAVTN